ncbi:MAG: M48 family metalloprotease [Anaerovibrio sp.]|uniref:M48 family metalloprotease n=1 Tax=Anaerovibrio sp. TaxID=1872532 RepID=UPI0025F54810|nr:M48 family metalloprotease [Anaerovibrio sp.]MCR5176849.1 M48 family metalloprotease [Anaerovibrio sp.]
MTIINQTIKRKSMLGKLIAAGLVTIGVFAGLGITGGINTVEAYMITCAQERNDGYNAYREKVLSQEHYKDAGLSALYKNVVYMFPKMLNFDDGRHKRWVDNDVVVIDNGTTNASMYPGGYMVFTKSMLDFCRTYENDGYISGYKKRGSDPDTTGLYANGMIMGVLCHEFSHHINEDYLKRMDKNRKVNILGQIIGMFTPNTPNAAAAQLGAAMFVHNLAVNGYSKPDERDADETAMKMMSQMTLYGVGDICAYHYRSGNTLRLKNKDPWKESKTHPSSFGRMKKAQDYIKKMADGKVKLRNYTKAEMKKYYQYTGKLNQSDSKYEYVLEINGKLFNEGRSNYPAGYALDNEENGLAQDRTFHIAGQIASAMESGVFKKRNIRYISAKDYNDGTKGSKNSGYVYVNCSTKSGGSVKLIIDRVDLDEFYFNKAIKDGMAGISPSSSRYNEMAVVKGIYDAAED